MIIGISAKKQGGKSTFIEVLKSQISDAAVLRFADKLKEIVVECFIPQDWHWSVDDLDSDEKKNTALPCGKTVRYLLQTIGTDWFRTTWEDCWVNSYISTASKIGKSTTILTPDVRFPNELRLIQKQGGKVVRLTRAPFSSDTHLSETALDPAMWATILHWDRFDLNQSLDSAFEVKDTWVMNMLFKMQSWHHFSDLYARWQQDPVLFDFIIDNQCRSEEKQRQWIIKWSAENL